MEKNPLQQESHLRNFPLEGDVALRQICNQIFNIEEEDIQDVLRQSAELLDMDPDMVERSGTLMIGSTDIRDLKEHMPVHARVRANLDVLAMVSCVWWNLAVQKEQQRQQFNARTTMRETCALKPV